MIIHQLCAEPLKARLVATVIAALCATTLAGCEDRNQPPANGVALWLTTIDQKNLLTRQADIPFENGSTDDVAVVNILRDQQRQEIVGFGASITDASAWLLHRHMNEEQRADLMRELFGPPPGLNLSLTRLTIGASDFSRSHYTYNDMPKGETDPELTNFSIAVAKEDVLPMVRQAMAINPQLKVMASPWSAPAWMKDSDYLIQGRLSPEHYPAFARYFVKTIDAFAAEGVPLFAITIQNEPHYEPDNYPGMGVPPESRARFIGDHLGPIFDEQGISTLILEWDHNWDEPESPLAVLADVEANPYVDGVAWHCYGGSVETQSSVRDAYPDKDVYLTECSGGDWVTRDGGWDSQFSALLKTIIIGGTRHWAKGIQFWNLALDEDRGPFLGGCDVCTGIVEIDKASGEVKRNAEYYAIGHASRFVLPGARRIAAETRIVDLHVVAFENPEDRNIVLLVYNDGTDSKRFTVNAGDQQFSYMIPGRAGATFSWHQ